MLQLQKNWLADVPWEKVQSLHEELCHGRQLNSAANPPGLERARALWERAATAPHTLLEALDTARRCIEAKPFEFLNVNTLTAAARLLLEEGLERLPSVEAQIIRTTVSHYIAGQIPLRELRQVLGHFENAWVGAPGATAATTPAPRPEAPRPATLPRLA